MKQYRLNNYSLEEYDLERLLKIMRDWIEMYEEETFADEFDELNPAIEIAGYTCKASKALKILHHDTYNEKFEGWISKKLEQLEKELAPLNHRDWINFMRNVIEVRIK